MVFFILPTIIDYAVIDEITITNGIMIPLPDLRVIIVVLISFNTCVFILFTCDKNAARNNAKRISERTLIFLALIGPFGAYGAMKVFRHKTQKIKFYLVPVFAILHMILLTWSLVSYLC